MKKYSKIFNEAFQSYFLIGLIIFITSCAGPRYKDSAFLQYVEKFENLYNISASNIAIFFDVMEETTGGICSGRGVIKINKELWFDITSDAKKEALIFHELGHCLLGRDHVDDLFDDGCPISLMHPILISEYCYEKHKEDLQYELIRN